MSLGIVTVLVVTTDIDPRVSLTRADLPGLDLGPVEWVLRAGTIIFATTNAVNVTDGLDGFAGGSAVTTNTPLLLVLICGINVVEAGAAGLQMAVFRASGRRRRLFLMPPIHHHYEVKGEVEGRWRGGPRRRSSSGSG